MERRIWRFEVDGRQMIVEYKAKLAADGEVVVDGNVAGSWGSSWVGLPKEVKFVINSRPAVLRRVGLLSQHFELIFDGKIYSAKEGRT